uniref:Endosome-associated-trafficking regulator 1 n=1 Tax=Cyprinus carpio carpio TaxID=630221 RepID=A0A9J7Z7X0_CYPCA
MVQTWTFKTLPAKIFSSCTNIVAAAAVAAAAGPQRSPLKTLREPAVYSPESRPLHRYEGDEKTSVIDISFHPKRSNAENGTKNPQQLREENSLLRKQVKELLRRSESDSKRIKQLTDELHSKKLQEEREAKALETMVQSVEQNLQLMTKRAVKAENSIKKFKQEIQQLQGQLEGYKSENERLRYGETIPP